MPAKPTSRAAAVKPRAAARPAPRTVVVRTPNGPRATRRVDAAKYEAMRRVLLRVLPGRAPGLTQAEMFRAVKPHLPESLFPGGATSNWWAKWVQLDLESRRVLVREETKPLRWRRRSRA